MSLPSPLDEYEFELPEESIAQRPSPQRADARMLVWGADGRLEDSMVSRLVSRLREGDLLVLNDSRVFPARLYGVKQGGSARVELLLIAPRATPHEWEALVRPGRRVPEGARVRLDDGLELELGPATGGGRRLLRFPASVDVMEHAWAHGHMPLPPYIRRDDDELDHERYQTVFARHDGSVAAPTAGLHLDESALNALADAGIEVARVTLHVGPGTFRPVDEEDLRRGRLHQERYHVPSETMEALFRCRQRAGRVVAVGTTACRALESLPEGAGASHRGTTELFIQPGHRFRRVDLLLTNFHLPRSSLLMLVAAFAGPRWRAAYAHAVSAGYRFYSYGDANLIESAARRGG